MASETTEDRFLGGLLLLRQPVRGFRAGMDSVFLAAAVPAQPGDSVLELGCGAGAAILALGARIPGLTLAGLELQPDYAAFARGNAARNGMALEVIEGDVAAPPPALGARAFDHVLLNPPYFDRALSVRAGDPGRDLAHGGAVPLATWLALAARRLAPRGTVTVVLRAGRLPDLLAALPPGLGSPEVLPLAPREGRPPLNLLLRARKGGRAAFRLLFPLAIHAAPQHLRDGEDLSPWAAATLRDGAALPWN